MQNPASLSIAHFSPHIGTNFIPTDNEINQLKSLISEPCSRLTRLEAEMDDVYKCYTQLQQEHAKLSLEIKEYRGFMTSMRRIPAEIMQEIFLRCLPQTHNAIISVEQCPILLTRVCSRWREIALRCPALWSSIHIASSACYISPENFAMIDEIARRRTLAVSVWLGRSGACTLDITLHESGLAHPLLKVLDNTAFNAILPFAERWGSLILDVQDARSIARIVSEATNLPRLHTLSFRGATQGKSRFWRKSNILRAPNLKNVEYTKVTEDFTEFRLHFSQLTNLSLHGNGTEQTSTERLAWLLLECPLLRSCSLNISSKKELSTPISIIPLLFLTQLNVRAYNKGAWSIFGLLHVPNLQELELHAFESAPVLEFLQRTGHKLRALTLNPFLFRLTEITECMRDWEELEVLKFVCHYYGSTIVKTSESDPNKMKELALNDDLLQIMDDIQCPLIPKLATFVCAIPSKISEAGILEFIKARHLTLRVVHVLFEHYQTVSIKVQLENLKQDGIDCQLTFPAPRPKTPNLKPKPKCYRIPASQGIKVEHSLVPYVF